MEIIIENLLLREIEDKDFDEIHEFASDEEVCQYQAWGPNCVDDTKNYIESAFNERHVEPRVNFNLVIYSLIDRKVIGTCGIFLKESKVGEIGFTIGKEFWGRGIGTKVARALISFSLKNLKLDKVFATCDVLNEGSRAVLKKVGFQQIKIINNHINIRGRSRDTLYFEFQK